MPSQERKAMFYISHSQMDLKAKPLVAWNQERKSFISHIYFIINHSCWGEQHSPGRSENLYGINAWKACRSIQYKNAAEDESSFSKDALPAQNTKMNSSIVISQMIDENKSKENKAAFPMQSVITQSDAYHMNQSLSNHSSVSVNRAFILLPRRLGVQISSDDNVFGTDSETKEKEQCHNQKKGFTSITITARRVVPPFHKTTWANTSDPSCLQGHGGKLLTNTTTASDVSELNKVSRSLHDQGSENRNASKTKVSELRSQLCRGSSDWLSNTENKENKMVSPENSHNKKASSSYTSSVHFSISQQSPNTVYYIDKSLSVPINQTQSDNQKIHRSVVSFHINCSSPSLTPDGVDGLVNGKLITELLKTKPPEDSKTSLQDVWHADPKENYLDRKQTLGTESLQTEYLWKCTSPPETPSVVDSPPGLSNLKLMNSNDKNLNDNHIRLSPLTPHWTYNEGDYKFCEAADKLKEYNASEKKEMVKRVTTSTVHGPDVNREKHEAFQQPGVCSEPENIPSNPLTLREALEVHKPQFISRSQERLKKLEHMVVLRKAQQGDALGKKHGISLPRKLSSLSITSKKKQYTVPHPLSDNLFKPKERYISEKEMHMRSKRIYNNLPEVKKKQEEKQKRVILQSNRLRVEVFKKQLLDQLLQRNTE